MQCDHRSESCFNFLTLRYFTGDLTEEAVFSHRGSIDLYRLTEQHSVSPAPLNNHIQSARTFIISYSHLSGLNKSLQFTVVWEMHSIDSYSSSIGVFVLVIWVLVSCVFIIQYRQLVFHILLGFFSPLIHDCCSFAYTQIFPRQYNQSYFSTDLWVQLLRLLVNLIFASLLRRSNQTWHTFMTSAEVC